MKPDFIAVAGADDPEIERVVPGQVPVAVLADVEPRASSRAMDHPAWFVVIVDPWVP